MKKSKIYLFLIMALIVAAGCGSSEKEQETVIQNETMPGIR